MNDKIGVLISLSFMFAMSGVLLYFWILKISDCVELNDAVTFLCMSVSLISIPLVFTFLLYWFWLASRCEQEDVIKKLS